MPYQPRHAAPSRLVIPRATHTVRFWTLPIVISVAFMTALAALYLGGILNPASNLRHFPIAVVNGDAGPSGAQIVDGLVTGGTTAGSTCVYFPCADDVRNRARRWAHAGSSGDADLRPQGVSPHRGGPGRCDN